MIFIILSLLISLCCLTGIFIIVGRRLSVISSIDVESIPAEREARVKNKIIEDRIQRKLGEFQRTAAFALVPLQGILMYGFNRIRTMYHWLLELREHHRKANVIGGARVSGEMEPVALPDSLEEARRFIREEKYDQAEKKYIDIISREKKSVEAYQGLADLYLNQKEWEQAQEVLLHVCKLQKSAMRLSMNAGEGGTTSYAQTLFKLGETYYILQEYEKALDYFKKALELQKNNPKYLNALAEVYIILKQRLRAEKTLENLRKVNPDNKKLSEFEEKIKEMPY